MSTSAAVIINHIIQIGAERQIEFCRKVGHSNDYFDVVHRIRWSRQLTHISERYCDTDLFDAMGSLGLHNGYR